MIVAYYDAVRELVGNENLIGGNVNGPLSKIEFVEGFTNFPTEEQIQAKIIELQANYDANQYQRDRAVAYPSYADQLDTIYHKGIDAWKEEIKTIKDKYPKP